MRNGVDIKKCLPSLSEKIPQATLLSCKKHGQFETFAPNAELVDASQLCPQCAAEKREELEKHLRRESYMRYCRECNVEEEYYFKTLGDFRCMTDGQTEAKAAVESMIKTRHGKILLLGPNGAGKTLLGSIAAKDLGGKIYSMYEISTMIRQSYTLKASRTELEIVSELATTPFLAIDELGRSKGSKAEMDWLSYVVDKRHTRGLPLMILTNGHLMSDCVRNGCDTCIENYIGNDVLSRFREDSRIIDLKGSPDGRR